MSGLSSGTIRQRLLESSGESLDELFKIASTMELAIADSKSFEPHSYTSTIAALSKSEKMHSPIKAKCFWCGGRRHPRSMCPARNSVCNYCHVKGHWTSACIKKSTNQTKRSAMICDEAVDPIDDGKDAHLLSSIIATVIPTTRGLVKAALDSHETEALIDTGSDSSFITLGFLNDHNLKYSTLTSTRLVNLADKSTLKVIGTYNGKVFFNNTIYDVTLNVVDNLIVPLIIGMNLLRQHSKVIMSFGGSMEPLEFCFALFPIRGTPTYRLLPNVDIDKLKPVATPSRRYSPHSDFIKSEIKRLLEDDIIQASQSPWRAQCFVTNTHKKPRLVIDFSTTINQYTPLDSYPAARIDDILDQVAVNKLFSRIDLRSAYHQVALHPEDYKLTAFEACGKLYEFKRLPFGCTNAVAIFQRTMDNFIADNNLQHTYAYLDDIIIGGRTKEEHDRNLEAFQKAALTYGLQINNEKCAYSQLEINFLGHTIQSGTFKPDRERVDSLLNFPTPRNLQQLNRLIGLFAYFAKWIPGCSEILLPLINSRKTISVAKSLPADAITAISRLKSLLADSTLSAPQYGQPFTIETDASENALGGSLSQNGKPIAFMSRTLSHSEKKQSVVEREACAIIECCRKWRSLLLSAPFFSIVTDQKSVSFLFSTQSVSKIKNDKLARWRLELSGYRFNIAYRPGSLNTAADTMSRIACVNTQHLQLLSSLHKRLCHPGVTRFSHYVKTRNLPYTLAEIRQTVNACGLCKELKPRFHNPPSASLITSTRSWERLSIDFIGPLPSTTPNKFLLVVIDEYSRYPFAFPCSRITDDVVISHLLSLFSMFGTPAAIHSDRGAQFESSKLR